MSPLDWICSLIKDAFSLFFWKLSLQWMSGFYWFCVTCALHKYSCLRWPRKERTKAVHMNIIVCLGFLCKDTYITVFGWILKAAGSLFPHPENVCSSYSTGLLVYTKPICVVPLAWWRYKSISNVTCMQYAGSPWDICSHSYARLM